MQMNNICTTEGTFDMTETDCSSYAFNLLKSMVCKFYDHKTFSHPQDSGAVSKSKISSRFDYFAWSMRWGNASIESDLRCINPLTHSPEGFY